MYHMIAQSERLLLPKKWFIMSGSAEHVRKIFDPRALDFNQEVDGLGYKSHDLLRHN
jgi:hypothetical protein